ncbi:MAG: YbaK/EbsC family protein [Pseudomonadota bacterium]|nr:YbaK/EbsC family protein [Pseudomonadota bacterium]
MNLDLQPAHAHPELLAKPVAAALAEWPGEGAAQIEVAAIDPDLADTAAFCEQYGVPLEESANCVVIAARRGGESTYAACLVTAVTRADVNGVVRRRLGARKASFAPVDDTLAATGMEYGGITPIGLPPGWPVLIDAAVVRQPHVIIGSGIRGSKLRLPGTLVATLPSAEVIEGLATPVM